MQKKVLFVFGTRPEAIKLAPLIRLFKDDSATFITGVCVTAQHREMLDQVLELFELVPDWDLDIMKKDQDLFDITAKVLLKIKNVFIEFNPDIVIVQGDTTTSMAAALASYYMQIPVGHVEAGLRTNNRYSPWPEEINRQITSRISSFHFAPTDKSRLNLLTEGISGDKIIVTGNTIIDALNYALSIINENPPEIPGFSGHYIKTNSERDLVLITGHRRENFGKALESVCHAIISLAGKFPYVHFVYPVHLNPNIHETVMRLLGSGKLKNIHLIKPLGYLPFVALMNMADIILTDSGGVQEEAPSLGKPVLVMRQNTERPEGLQSGIAKMIGTEQDPIFKEISRLLTDDEYYSRTASKSNPYGDGKASHRILKFVKNHFSVL
jgi:UDP-N-acetylglucosamine 2-epimerase (non-hydrolysing)